jgi:uncharacterized tellurite resistance protein B-like protein
MFEKLLQLLSSTPKPTDDTVGGGFERKQLAVAALLVEVSQVDRTADPQERAAVLRAIRERFALGGEAAEELVRLAEGELAAALDDWIFTEAVRNGFAEADREEIVYMLWEVVYADGELAKLEEELMERLVEALGVSEYAVTLARSAAFARVGLGGARDPGDKAES